MFMKAMFEKPFEYDGKICTGVGFKNGVKYEVVGDCEGNPKAFHQFTIEKNNQVVLTIATKDNRIMSLSGVGSVPAEFASIDPNDFEDLPEQAPTE